MKAHIFEVIMSLNLNEYHHE